jgi:hypothetical protein
MHDATACVMNRVMEDQDGSWIQRRILTGVALSLGAALFRSLWQPAVSRYGRPLAKGAVKGSLAAFEIGRGRVAEFGETMQDLVAEAQVERAIERAQPGSATPPPAADGTAEPA